MVIEKIRFENFRKGIGMALWRERYRRSLTIEHIAKKLRIPPKQIDRIEQGKTASFSITARLLKFYKKKISIELVE